MEKLDAHAESINNTKKEVTFEIHGKINLVKLPKTKAFLQPGDIVVQWGKKFKKATPQSKGPFGIVKEVLNNEAIVYSS